MKKTAVSRIMLTLLLIGMLTLAFNIQPVKADWTWTETIYIRADGSVDPDTAPISSVDNITYTLTDNIIGDVPKSAIIVEKDNIVVDGANYTLQGTGASFSIGILLSGRSNVTIKNIEIKGFSNGIYLYESSNYNTISGNNITNNDWNGIHLKYNSNYNAISYNNILNNRNGINIEANSNNNYMLNNYIADSEWDGIDLKGSHSNSIKSNTITNCFTGIYLGSETDNMNIIYHNNLINNMYQVTCYSTPNMWDDGYPSGGNYWSDYTVRYPSAQELDDSGIWNTPYVIDDNNQDNFPLMEPWSPLPRSISELKTEIEELGSEDEIDNQGIVKSLTAKLKFTEKLVDKGKVDEAKTILADDFIPQVQNLTGIHITVGAADILIQSAEYILSHL